MLPTEKECTRKNKGTFAKEKFRKKRLQRGISGSEKKRRRKMQK